MVAILTFEFAIETCLIVEFPVDAQTVIWTGTGNIAFENVVGIDDRFVVAREFMDNTAFHVRLDITVFADFPFFAQDETGTACYDIGILVSTAKPLSIVKFLPFSQKYDNWSCGSMNTSLASLKWRPASILAPSA